MIQEKAIVEATPQAYVRESVLDYVKLRRERGATANAVVRNLLTYRNKVIVAPSGSYGRIVDVITKKAGSQLVSETDDRNLVEFWKQIYDIDISSDEIPLLKVKMMNSENVFTYPPTCAFLEPILYLSKLMSRSSLKTKSITSRQKWMMSSQKQ